MCGRLHAERERGRESSICSQCDPCQLHPLVASGHPELPVSSVGVPVLATSPRACQACPSNGPISCVGYTLSSALCVCCGLYITVVCLSLCVPSSGFICSGVPLSLPVGSGRCCSPPRLPLARAQPRLYATHPHTQRKGAQIGTGTDRENNDLCAIQTSALLNPAQPHLNRKAARPRRTLDVSKN